MAGSEGSSYAPLDVRDAMSSPMLRGGGGATFGSDGEKGRVAAAPAPVRHQRVLSAWGVASLAFFITCAGPYGIEAAVTAAGPLITLIGTALMPFIWAVPMGFFTGELSSMISENGGYILWVQDAFGPFVGWINGWSCLVANVIDLPVYLVLGADYINAYLSSGGGAGLSLMHRSLLQGAVLLLTAAFNLRGLEVVDKVSMVFALAVCLPFVIMPIVLAARSEFHASLAFAAPPDEIDWATFLNTIGWAWMGWDALGCIAGEVDDPGTSYPKGVIITAVANAFVYALPIITAVSLIPDPDHWHTATFTDAGQAVGAWLGIMVVISGLFSSKLSSTALLCASLTSLAVLVPDMGIYQASLATSSRALWAMGGGAPEEIPKPMVPRVFAKTWKRYDSPWVAIVAETLTSAVLMQLTFTQLVALDVFFTNITGFLEIGAFVWLRVRDPRRNRPFKVPWGWTGVALVAVPQLSFAAVTMVLQPWEVWVGAVGMLAVFALAYWLRERFDAKSGTLDSNAA